MYQILHVFSHGAIGDGKTWRPNGLFPEYPGPLQAPSHQPPTQLYFLYVSPGHGLKGGLTKRKSANLQNPEPTFKNLQRGIIRFGLGGITFLATLIE